MKHFSSKCDQIRSVTFTEEILKENLNFCAVDLKGLNIYLSKGGLIHKTGSFVNHFFVYLFLPILKAFQFLAKSFYLQGY